MVCWLTPSPRRRSRFQLTGLAIGGHAIVAKAYDSKNLAETTVNVTVQNGAPQPEPPDPDGDGDGDGDADGDGKSDVITGGCQSGGAGGGLTLLGLAALIGGIARRRRVR